MTIIETECPELLDEDPYERAWRCTEALRQLPASSLDRPEDRLLRRYRYIEDGDDALDLAYADQDDERRGYLSGMSSS